MPTPCAVITVNPPVLPNGSVGTAYQQTFTASPGGAYTFSVSAGSLPAGLTLDPGTGVLSGTPTASGNFTFTIRATGSGNCSGERIYTLNVASPAGVCTQAFDTVTAPALPGGWTSSATGAVGPWITSTNNPNSSPNAATSSSSSTMGQNNLTSPSFYVGLNGAQVSFMNAFNFQEAGGGSPVGFDGMVLEISINNAAFQDVIAAGGSFVTGGYNRVISPDFGNSLAGQAAWSGLSGGTTATPAYLTTTLNLPPAANNRFIVLRWRVGTDVTGNAPGAAGARIDTIRGVGCTPTAAGVALSGRVTTADGRGLRNAVVTLLSSDGLMRTTVTSSFGFYSFDDVGVGATYVVSVSSRRYRFTARVVEVVDSLNDIDFLGHD